MNTGDIALVEEINYDLPLRPVIRIINKSSKALDRSKIDLKKEQNLVIKNLQFDLP